MSTNVPQKIKTIKKLICHKLKKIEWFFEGINMLLFKGIQFLKEMNCNFDFGSCRGLYRIILDQSTKI
jgi:hypothetical protein